MRVERELRNRMLLAACVGVLAWSGPIVLIPISLALPVLCHWPSPSINSRERGFVAFAYFAAALWPVTAAGIQLYGIAAVPFLMVVSLAASGLLAVPFCIPSVALPLILTAVPPIGIIGVANPLTASGVLFPDTAWFGIIATLLLPGALIRFPRAAVTTVALVSLTLNAFYHSSQPPNGWQGVNTTFGDIRDKKDRGAEFRAAQWIQETALGSKARVLVFPELAVTRWTEATEAFWQPTLQQLAAQRRTMLIGAGIAIPGTQDYQNVLIAVPSLPGDETKYVSQSIPLPWVMWNPIASKDRVRLRLWSGGTLKVDDERAAVLICYEQLISWPILKSTFGHPTAIVAISNAVWTRGTPIPAVQSASVVAWSRLFNLPVISSVNQ